VDFRKMFTNIEERKDTFYRSDYRVKKELTIEIMFQQMFALVSRKFLDILATVNVIGALPPNNHSPTKSAS
jgi:hypothetical protein